MPGSGSYGFNGSIIYRGGNSSFAWFGPYTSLLPGKYSVTFHLITSNISKNNSIKIEATYNDGYQALNSSIIHGDNFSATGKTMNFTLNLSNNFYAGLVEFRGIDADWNGTLQLTGVTLRQNAA